LYCVAAWRLLIYIQERNTKKQYDIKKIAGSFPAHASFSESVLVSLDIVSPMRKSPLERNKVSPRS